VVDCSALVRALADDNPLGEAVRERLSQVATPVASALIDYEFMSALLGMARGGKLVPHQVSAAMAAYQALNMNRHETLGLWDRVRELNHNISAYNAQYVALAEALDLPLITCDARIARSGAAKCPIEIFA
jgi:predicted nucleic acid-binding protein